MLLDMALGSKAPASFQHRCRVTAALLLIVCVTLTKSAPTTYDEIEAKQTDLANYFNNPNGCYYNYQHYDEGDRIVTNEPCLNCTCHNRMLMCYLRVCPFSKAIGQDCTVQKTPDQCCPTISCPEVPVHLLTSSTTPQTTTTTTTTTSTTTVGWHDDYGCMMDENGFFPDGAQVPIDLKKPCELCYCIRNRTACVIQQCTLHVEGCRPVYQDGVCCPVRYDCDYEIEKSTTTTPQISGGLVFATTSAPFDCRVNDEVYADGESIAMNSAKPCEHCYCMRGDIVCVVQDCGEPLRGKDCTPEAPPAGQCCPTSYQCANETMDSYGITTLQPASQSDTDEHEAEKFPSNDDVYNKLGENQQDDKNDIESEHANTTPVANNEIPPAGMSDQTDDTDEETHDSVPDSPAAAEGTTALPASDSVTKINGENQQEISSAKPDSPNQVNPVGSESDLTKLASTDKPVESSSADSVQQTQAPAADSSSVNENAASPTTQATSDGNSNVPVNEGNAVSDSPIENSSQDVLASNSPVVTTENAAESETQSSNLQDDKSQEEIKQQTDAPSVIEKEPTKSSQDEQTPEQPTEITPQSEITSNKIEEPTKTSDEGSTESNVGENKVQTSAPLNENVEQSTQQITSDEPEKTPLDETNAQTVLPSNIIQDSLDQINKIATQTPQEDISVTDGPSSEKPNAQINENSQEGNIFSTEVPKTDNEPVEQNNIPVENKPQTENLPESGNVSSEQNQDGSQVENEPQTEIPTVVNEPTEQNRIQEENKPAQTETKPESEKTPTPYNQDAAQGEIASPTELPKVDDQNKLQEENASPTGLPTLENQDKPQEGNVSPTDVPKIENEPTEQNKPIVEDHSQTGSQPESDATATEPNSQGDSHSENEPSTEIPKVINEQTEQNKPLVEENSQTGNQPESDPIALEPNSQGDSQSDNQATTEIPKVINEQNKPLVEENSQTGNQPESDPIASEPNSQGDSQSDNQATTEIPKVENEPNEQNKPLVESVPGAENQPKPENTPVEQNQDSPQVENTSTDIPKEENDPTKQNKPFVDTVTEQNIQDSSQSGTVPPTEISQVENKPNEQEKLTEEDKPQAENQPISENTSADNIDQNSPQLDNESTTEIPKVENEPTEQNKPSVENIPTVGSQPESVKTPLEPSNQDSPQQTTDNLSSTDTPKVENAPKEQNKPSGESGAQSEDQPESQNTSTEVNQNSQQIENVPSTDIPKVENEPVEQNKAPVESSSQSENQAATQHSPTDANQNSQQIENVPSTDIPKVENEPVEQNKSPMESNSQSENQAATQNSPTEANQNSQQIENVPSTDIPKVENEPVEQDKPPVENNVQTENQSEPQKTPVSSNQDGVQVENVSPTGIPTKLSESQPENVSPIKPDTPVIPVNDLPTEQPINDNNIFIVTSTSSPLPSQNQIKDKESASNLDKNENDETDKKEDNASEKPQKSADDKISSIENTNTDNNVVPVSSTELTPGSSDNASPQTNDENTKHPTETKPTENEVTAGVSDNLANAPVSSTPTIETNDDLNSELINQGVLVDDPSAQENEPSIGEESDVSNADSGEHQTETPTETVSSANGEPLSVDEHINDVTTNIPQQQLTDNNIPVQPEVVNANAPEKTQDGTKIASSSPENNEPEKSIDGQVSTEVNEIQNSDDLLKPTESPTLVINNGEQSTPTQIPVKINENEIVTSHEPSQNEDVNEVLDQTTVYADTSSDKNNLNGASGLNQNNQENVTPLFVETSTNAQISNGEPIKNINQDGPVENESSTISQLEQVSQGSSENADDVENSVTTNNYANVPSIVQTTNAPAVQENDNKGSFSAGQPDKIEINADNDQPENIKPQESFSSDETSTQYNADDSSTNSPVHSSPGVNNNADASTNSPADSETANEIKQDSVTESESYATESPTEKNVLAADSDKTPTNDATMEAISNLPEQPSNSHTSANEITNENSSEEPQDADKPFVTKPADYVIDITTVSNESPNIVSELIKTGNEANEMTTSYADKNSDVTTELYNENVQPGVPGEGSCLIDFVTYAHKAIVPKSNPCHEKCECLNSIVTCTSVNCPPAPPQHRNCIPLHPGNESWCCPTYMCDGGIEGMIFENHNNEGAPQLISTVVLEDKPGEENNDNASINEEVSTTFSPQIVSEYNTLAPPQTDQNSEVPSLDAIGINEVPAQTEIPDKQVDDSVAPGGEYLTPTTVSNLETIETKKPVEQDKPEENNEVTDNDKPVESDQPSEYEKPAENYKPTENEKPEDSTNPAESDQPTENEKPVDDPEADVTTISYASDGGQTATNIPETSNNSEEQNVVVPNTDNEPPQSYPVPSTEIPNNYESTVQSLQPDSDLKQPEQISDSHDSVAATTYKPEDSLVNQQVVDDTKTEGVDQPTSSEEEANAKPSADVTNLPPSDVSPIEVTQTPVIVADMRPTITETGDNGGLRPASIDEIINSVNMVKDAVKNSLETSSKPAEIDYQTTVGAVEDYRPTEVAAEAPASPSSSENTLPPAKSPQSTESDADAAPELPTTDATAVYDKSPESPAGATAPSSNPPPAADSDPQGPVSTDAPSLEPEKQAIADEDKTSGAVTEQHSPDAAGQDPVAPVVPTVSDNVSGDGSPDTVTARPDAPAAGSPALTDDVAVTERPDADVAPVSPNAAQVSPDAAQVSPDAAPVSPDAAPVSPDADAAPVSPDTAPVSPDADAAPVSPDAAPVSPDADAAPVSPDAAPVSPDAAPVSPDTAPVSPDAAPLSPDADAASVSPDAAPVSPDADAAPVSPDADNDKRFGEQSGSSAPASQEDHGHVDGGDDGDDEKQPPVDSPAGDTVSIPLDTEKPSARPSPVSSTPPPSAYTPIPQSTWTQKPFHQDSSTTEAPQPEQGYPDEYDDENEPAYGPGTCRYAGKIYVSAQQVPRDDPCDFCFCFRGDIICLQQSCPPPIFGCYQENIQGFCCPRYECPVAQATSVNVTTTTSSTTTMVPPHFFANAYRGAARRTGCLIHGHAYRVGEDVGIASGPCLECICGADGKMACDPKPCSPEPLLRKMMAEAVDRRR